MKALETPLEALALKYLTYGFFTAVNNLWAWVAVITAAVSFWRLRASSSPPLDAALKSSAPPEVAETAVAKAATVSSTPSATTSFRILEREGSTKMKFSLYYTEGGFGDGGETEDGGGGSAAAISGRKVERWCDEWERMMVVRMGDMGWYKWQDTAALDGSVVRLWEVPRRRGAAVVVGGGVKSMII